MVSFFLKISPKRATIPDTRSLMSHPQSFRNLSSIHPKMSTNHPNIVSITSAINTYLFPDRPNSGRLINKKKVRASNSSYSDTGLWTAFERIRMDYAHTFCYNVGKNP